MNTQSTPRRRRNFFLDEEEIVAETRRLEKQREDELARFRSELAPPRPKQTLDELVAKGIAWLMKPLDQETITEAYDIFQEDEIGLAELFFEVQTVTKQLCSEIRSEEKYPLDEQVVNIVKSIQDDSFFNYMLTIESFRIIISKKEILRNVTRYIDKKIYYDQIDYKNILIRRKVAGKIIALSIYENDWGIKIYLKSIAKYFSTIDDYFDKAEQRLQFKFNLNNYFKNINCKEKVDIQMDEIIKYMHDHGKILILDHINPFFFKKDERIHIIAINSMLHYYNAVSTYSKVDHHYENHIAQRSFYHFKESYDFGINLLPRIFKNICRHGYEIDRGSIRTAAINRVLKSRIKDGNGFSPTGVFSSQLDIDQVVSNKNFKDRERND